MQNITGDAAAMVAAALAQAEMAARGTTNTTERARERVVAAYEAYFTFVTTAKLPAAKKG